MARGKITKRTVEALSMAETLFDTELKGFMVRARGNSKNFAVKYSVRGRQRIFTLGRYGDLTPDQARSLAMDALNRANKARHDKAAHDPQSQREADRTAPKRLVAAVCADFVERHAKKNRTWRETERILRRYVAPLWGNRHIHAIGRLDVATLLDAIEEESGPAMASAVLAQLRKMFNWYAARDENFTSPIVAGMSRVSPAAQRRSRALCDDEIRTMWRALDRLEAPFPQLVRALLLSAQRRNEVACMIPKHELKGDIWIIPAERFKNGRAQAVPLSPLALQQLADLGSIADMGDFAFTTTGWTPFSGFSKCKARLDVEMEILLRDGMSDEESRQLPEPALEPWRIHDLRRTAKSLMLRAGVRPDITERVLGHVIAGVEGTYDVFDYASEKRAALKALADQVRSILADSSHNVVKIPPKAA